MHIAYIHYTNQIQTNHWHVQAFVSFGADIIFYEGVGSNIFFINLIFSLWGRTCLKGGGQNTLLQYQGHICLFSSKFKRCKASETKIRNVVLQDNDVIVTRIDNKNLSTSNQVNYFVYFLDLHLQIS